MNHYISVFERIISIDTGDDVIQNGVESDTLVITKDAEWNPMTRIVVVFKNGDKVYNKELGSDSTTSIPWEVLQVSGDLYITVIGYVGTEARIVTKEMDIPFRVLTSGVLDSETSYPYTPSELQQILNQVTTMKNQVEEDKEEVKQIVDGLTFPIPVSNGGTGATTASAALNNLGITWGTSAAPATGTPNTIYIQLL